MTDTEEWGAFLERILRATARRVGNGDIEGLAVIARVQRLVDETMQHSVDRLRAEPWEYSWADIGQRLGITRQAAQQRFGSKATYRQMDKALKYGIDETGTIEIVPSINQTNR